MSRPDDADAGPTDGEPRGSAGEAESGRTGGGRETPALLILVGVALFVFPEPITSYVGATLAAVGGLAWFVRLALG